ncbi:MAG: hypothetical protein ABF697_08790 [Zymomonas mobilis]|uniref:hypothetical protein n=1 Tax=Zymomonas mobilis TaxID=542 RepID=UPI0039EBB863
MLTGSALLTTLSSCTDYTRLSAPPVAVKVENRPPADLLVCADTVPAFPAQSATIPVDLRTAIEKLALGYRSNADRLNRLVNWSVPDTCK